MKLFFSVGEPSGDVHGANLIRELRQRRVDWKFVGYGGPKMASVGCELHEDLTKLAVMWLARALMNLHRFLDLLCRADRYFRHQRPDAVILIDYPGFNWWIARRAKVHNIPVFYYGTPQVWAWARWRVKKMRRLVDHALCKLPFEEPWYRDRGCNATFIGHPFFDEVRRYQLDADFLEKLDRAEGPLVAILPGSRTQEVRLNLPWMLKAAKIVHRQTASVRFAIAAFRPEHASMARQMIQTAGMADDLRIDVFSRRTPELIHASRCTMAVSGSVSLELLYHAKPTVVLYWISRAGNFAQSILRKIQYITLVNLLMHEKIPPKERGNYDPRKPGAAKVLFPEYLTSDDRSDDIASHVTEWLHNETERKQLVRQLETLRERVGGGGASRRAAEYIVDELEQRSASIPRPHFLDQRPPHPNSEQALKPESQISKA